MFDENIQEHSDWERHSDDTLVFQSLDQAATTGLSWELKLIQMCLKLQFLDHPLEVSNINTKTK